MLAFSTQVINHFMVQKREPVSWPVEGQGGRQLLLSTNWGWTGNDVSWTCSNLHPHEHNVSKNYHLQIASTQLPQILNTHPTYCHGKHTMYSASSAIMCHTGSLDIFFNTHKVKRKWKMQKDTIFKKKKHTKKSTLTIIFINFCTGLHRL